jgi:Leucine-rich repeat (LRR) protein
MPGNQLNGTIPIELSLLISLVQLYLDDNSLSGTVPTELGKLSLLYLVDISLNDLMDLSTTYSV